MSKSRLVDFCRRVAISSDLSSWLISRLAHEDVFASSYLGFSLAFAQDLIAQSRGFVFAWSLYSPSLRASIVQSRELASLGVTPQDRIRSRPERFRILAQKSPSRAKPGSFLARVHIEQKKQSMPSSFVPKLQDARWVAKHTDIFPFRASKHAVQLMEHMTAFCEQVHVVVSRDNGPKHVCEYAINQPHWYLSTACASGR